MLMSSFRAVRASELWTLLPKLLLEWQLQGGLVSSPVNLIGLVGNRNATFDQRCQRFVGSKFSA